MNEELLKEFENLKAKLQELDELKKKVSEIEQKSSMDALNISSDSLMEEIEEEDTQKKQYEMMQRNGVEIPHLKKKYEKKKSTTKRGHGARILLQSEIEAAQLSSASAFEAARKIGVAYTTYKKYAKLYGIHKRLAPYIGKKKNQGPINPYKGKYPINEIFESKWPNYPIHRLKDKLIRAGIKEPKCEQCGFSERRIVDGKMPLLLNFEDGNSKNHSKENLTILCYNCTFTSGKGYIRKGKVAFDPDIMQDSKKELPARF